MTQTDGSKLAALLSRIEAAEGPDRELDAAIDAALPPADPKERWCGCTGACKPDHPNYVGACVAVPRYTASLDACAALQDRVLPGYYWGLHQDAGGPWFKAHVTKISPVRPIPTIGKARTAALAWLAALVRALIAKHKGGTDGPGQA